jgi:uncharacterized protein (TIGR02118 family)
MTVKLIALYEQPADEAAFLDHYTRVHLPLVEKIPGLQRAVVNRVVGNAMGGEAPYFLIAEMHYADRAAFEANFAAGKVKLLIVEEQG